MLVPKNSPYLYSSMWRIWVFFDLNQAYRVHLGYLRIDSALEERNVWSKFRSKNINSGGFLFGVCLVKPNPPTFLDRPVHLPWGQSQPWQNLCLLPVASRPGCPLRVHGQCHAWTRLLRNCRAGSNFSATQSLLKLCCLISLSLWKQLLIPCNGSRVEEQDLGGKKMVLL